MSGYHKQFIMKHQNDNQVNKLKEEVEELRDAIASGNTIMALQEMSDVYLSLRNIVTDYGFTMRDLVIMADTTKDVFESGCRVEPSLYDIIEQNVMYTIPSKISGAIPLLCNDTSYCYIYSTDEVDYFPPPTADYFEVLYGVVKNEAGERLYNGLHQCDGLNTMLKFDRGAIILTKYVGLNDYSLFSTISCDKDDIQLKNLKQVISEN